MKSIEFTQAEANALLIQTVGRLDHFDEELKEAGRKGDANRVLEVAKVITVLKSSNEKLLNAGARLDWIL